MFKGEPEILARRKALAVLQDEMKQAVDAARELPFIYSALLKNDSQTMRATIERARKAVINVELFESLTSVRP